MTSQNLLNTSMRLINSLDEVLNKVEINEEEKMIRIERSTLAVEVWSLKNVSYNHVVGIADVTTMDGMYGFRQTLYILSNNIYVRIS